MTDTISEITTLLAKVDWADHGPTQRAWIDRAIALADEAGEQELAYKARMHLVASAYWTGDTDAALTAFVWCIGMNESDPLHFPTALRDGIDLLWFYKWMPSSLGSSPIFPLEEIERVMEQMAERFTREGVGMGAVAQARFDEARIDGRLEEAELRRMELKSTPRDEYSHCEACVRRAEGQFLALVGRESEALVLFDEMFEQDLSCGTEPETALASALLPLLRAGRLGQAKAAHLRSYRAVKQDADRIGVIADHLVFCAVTGNESRGLTLLERHIGWLAHDGLDDRSHFSAFLAVGVLLDAIDRAGLGATTVRGAAVPELVRFFGEHEGQWSVHELAAAAWSAATALGARFDERNANGHYADRIRSARGLANEHYDLPLDAPSFVPLPGAVRTEPTDAPGWLLHARELAGAGLHDEAIAAVESGLALDPDAEQRSGLDLLLIQRFAGTEREDKAIAAITDRVEALRALGRTEQAEIEQSLGPVLFGTAEEEDLPRLLEALERAADPAVRADLAVTAGMLLVILERFEQAKPLLQRGIADATVAGAEEIIQTGMRCVMQVHSYLGEPDAAAATADALLDRPLNRSNRATMLSWRSRALFADGDTQAALADAEAAFALAVELGARPMLIEFGTLSAGLLSELDRDQESANRWRLVVREAELAERSDLDGMRFNFARALVYAGNADEAIETLEELKEHEESSGANAGARAETRLWLGRAYRLALELPRAYMYWRDAVGLYEEFEDFAGAAAAGFELGTLLMQLEDSDADAQGCLESALENARKAPEQTELLLNVLHLLAKTKCRNGETSGLDALDEAMAIAKANEEQWFMADLTYSRARCLQLLDRADEAIPIALEAADLYLAADSVEDAGNAELLVAQLLTRADRPADAAPIFASALEKLTDDPGSFIPASLEYGEVLESLGRLDEAAAIRAAASS